MSRKVGKRLPTVKKKNGQNSARANGDPLVYRVAMPYDPTRVAKLVNEYKESSGLSWREMAKDVCCSSGTLRAIAKGDTRAMRLDTAYKLAEAMDVEIWHLIGDEPKAIAEARAFSERMRGAIAQIEDKTGLVQSLLDDLREIQRLTGKADKPRK